MLVKSLLFAIISSVFVPALASSCTRTYTAQEGDYCDKISAAHNVSTYQLAVLNPPINSDCTNLIPGQILCLGNSAKDCTSTHIVKPNDDCNIVSSAYHINSTILLLNNPQLYSNCSNLYIGEVLCVAEKSAAPPPPSSGKIPATAIPATAAPAKSTGAPDDEDGDDDDGSLPWCD